MLSLFLALALTSPPMLPKVPSSGPTPPAVKGLMNPIPMGADTADLVAWSLKEMGQAVVVVEGELPTLVPKRQITGLNLFDGKIKLLGFVNNANMGSFTDALALARATNTIPDVAKVRRYRARPGGTLNVEQGLTDDLGFFLRASENDGSKESFEFTDINESLSAGLSLKGTSWDRKDDTVGAAFVVDGISKDFQAYLAAGGLGVLVGDGQLPHYSSEAVLETYYDVQIIKGVEVALDYQFVANPGYNPDRGPVSVLGFRLHGEF